MMRFSTPRSTFRRNSRPRRATAFRQRHRRRAGSIAAAMGYTNGFSKQLPPLSTIANRDCDKLDLTFRQG